MFQLMRIFSALFVAFLIISNFVNAQKNELPEGYEQILPRGRIAAINNPTFVPANKAKINDNSWVLGVVLNGEARAYSLNLLNHHEVVNDQIGDTAFAAVW